MMHTHTKKKKKNNKKKKIKKRVFNVGLAAAQRDFLFLENKNKKTKRLLSNKRGSDTCV